MMLIIIYCYYVVVVLFSAELAVDAACAALDAGISVVCIVYLSFHFCT